ncbi:hypothetical protein [Treponema sp. R6D11]
MTALFAQDPPHKAMTDSRANSVKTRHPAHMECGQVGGYWKQKAFIYIATAKAPPWLPRGIHRAKCKS